MRMMLRSAARKSRLIDALFNPQSEFLDGMTTYVMKLGAENLVPPYDRPMDRQVAASPHIGLLRLRMQQTARLLADGLVEDLGRAADAPLRLINIGGGPALDSINALILLRRARPDLFEATDHAIRVPGFQPGPDRGSAANALAALQATPGRPLHGVDVAWHQRDYDWNAPAALEQLVADVTSAGGLIAASSEGALFEYGSDAAIVANLTALRAGGTGAKLVAGSVTSADDLRRRMIAQTRFKVIPRGIAGFAPLAARAGFTIANAATAHLSDQVLLRPFLKARGPGERHRLAVHRLGPWAPRRIASCASECFLTGNQMVAY